MNALKRPSTQKEIQIFRRKALLQATLKSISKHGLNGTTVQTISDLSGGSRGLVNDHFKNKDDLLVAAYRYLTDEWNSKVGKKMREAGPDAYARLQALADSSFKGSLVDKLLTPYLSFWIAAQHSKAIRSVNMEITQRYRETVSRLFQRAATELGTTVKVEEATLGLLALIDGLWIQTAVDSKTFSAERASQICRTFIDQSLGVEQNERASAGASLTARPEL